MFCNLIGIRGLPNSCQENAQTAIYNCQWQGIGFRNWPITMWHNYVMLKPIPTITDKRIANHCTPQTTCQTITECLPKVGWVQDNSAHGLPTTKLVEEMKVADVIDNLYQRNLLLSMNTKKSLMLPPQRNPRWHVSCWWWATILLVSSQCWWII